MDSYRKGAHTVFSCKYHIVWVTKYRYQVLSKDIGLRVRELVRQISIRNQVQILKGHVSSDHVHIHVSIPPSVAVSKYVQYLKVHTSVKLLKEFRSLSKRYWGQDLWARGYFVSTTGTVSDEVIQKYISGHEKFEEDDGFTIGH